MNLSQRPDVSPLRILEYLGLSKISGDVRHHSSARLMCYSMLSGSLLFASSWDILPWITYFQRADLVNSLFQNLVDLFLTSGWSPNHPKQPLKPSLIWSMATSSLFPTCSNSSFYLIKTSLCCSSTGIVNLCLCISPSPGCESSSSSWSPHSQCSRKVADILQTPSKSRVPTSLYCHSMFLSFFFLTRGFPV